MKKRWRKIEYDLINKQQAIKEAVNNWKLSKRMLSVLGLAVTVFCITMIALLVFFRHRMKAQVLDYSDNTVYLMSVSTDQLMKNIEESTIQIISMPAIIEFLQQEDMDEVTLYHSKKKSGRKLYESNSGGNEICSINRNSIGKKGRNVFLWKQPLR